MEKRRNDAINILYYAIGRLEEQGIDVKELDKAFLEVESFSFSAVNKIEELEDELEMIKDNL